MGFFDELMAGLLSPRGVMTMIPAAMSLAGSLFAKRPKETVTQSPSTSVTTTESPMLRELLGEARSALPQPLTEADIARERQIAGAGGQALAAGRGIQVPGYPYAGNLANTISAEAMLEQGVKARRFNLEQAGRNAAALTAMGSAAPRTTTESRGPTTATTIGPPRTFDALASAGKSLGEIFPAETAEERERKRKQQQPIGVFDYDVR